MAHDFGEGNKRGHDFGRGLRNGLALKSFRAFMKATAKRGERGLRHEEDNERCWCRPDLKKICPEACCELHDCPDDCWRCGGTSMVPADGD